MTGTTGDGVGAGAMNTAMIVAAQINDTPGDFFAAKVCADYSVKAADGVTYGDWYLPSLDELILLRKQIDVVGGLTGGWYWSSTEEVLNKFVAWAAVLCKGGDLCDDASPGPKDLSFSVRCVRAF